MPLAIAIISRSIDQFNIFDFFYAMHIAQQIEHLFHFMKMPICSSLIYSTA